MSFAARKGGVGKPTVEREVIKVTFFDDFTFDVCGVETDTTQTQRTIIKTFPDGSETVHRVAEWITDRIAPDGTVAVYGLAIRLFRQGEGTIIRDAGWIRFLEDGLVFRGPHPFIGDTDPPTCTADGSLMRPTASRRRSDLRRRLRF